MNLRQSFVVGCLLQLALVGCQFGEAEKVQALLSQLLFINPGLS